jgi:nucleoside phosphorylase
MPKSYVAIFVATSLEFGFIKKALTNPRRILFDGILCASGILNNHDILLVKTGVGLLNAKRVFDAVIHRPYKISLVINVGTGGALNPAYAVGGVVIVQRVINENDHMAFTANPVDCEMEGVCSLYTQSTLISVNQPVLSTLRKDFYRKAFDADVVDMEAAVLLQGSIHQCIPCHVIKGISDYADESMNFPEGLLYADEKLIYRKEKILISFLQRPVTFIKALINIYMNGKFAMKNAIGVLEKVLMP